MSISIVGYTDDHFNPASALLSAAGVSDERWIDFATTLAPSDRVGTEEYPFGSWTELDAWIGAHPSPCRLVHIRGNTSVAWTAPQGALTVLEGILRDDGSGTTGTFIGDLTLPEGTPFSWLVLRNIKSGDISFSSAGGGVSALILESANTGQILNTGAASDMVFVQSPGGNAGGSVPSNVNTVSIVGGLVANAANFQGALACGALYAIECQMPASTTLSGTDMHVRRCAWSSTPTVTFSGPSGTMDVDEPSCVSFGLLAGNLVNGEAKNANAGPQLVRADNAFNAFQCAIVGASSGHIDVAATTSDPATVGIVYPAVLSGLTALLWTSGTTIPANPGGGVATYYRDPVTGDATTTAGTQQIGNSDGGNFYVDFRTPLNTSSLFGLVPLPADAQVFTGSGTWTKPVTGNFALITVIGGGGGGGSGYKGIGGVADMTGGGGGGGGAYTQILVPLSLLGATETVVVGTGGTGGPIQFTPGSSGHPGDNGTASSFGSWARASGGDGGSGGVFGFTAPGGSGGLLGLWDGANGVDGKNNTPVNWTTSRLAGGGGGGGGGIDSFGTSYNGGKSGFVFAINHAQALGGVAPGGNGAVGASPGNPLPGIGGGGGAAGDATTPGGAGGKGGNYGGGGGGGGAAGYGVSPADSGPGGEGADGIVVVYVF